MYATVEDLRKRLDENVLRYLTDEHGYGVENEDILYSALVGASAKARNLIPAALATDVEFVKEIELLLAIAILYRRFGYEAEASEIETSVREMLATSVENVLNTGTVSDPQVAATDSFVSSDEWNYAFTWMEDDEV